jgi:hypothetical protein
MMRPQSDSYLQTLEQAGASIKCTFEESDRATEFIANTVFVEGEEEKVSQHLRTPLDELSCVLSADNTVQ